VVGAGGVGKTTVALSVMNAFKDAHGLQSYLVELSSLPGPDLVATAVASALGVVASTYPALESVTSALRSKPTFLLLDNCEHVMEGAAAVAEALFDVGLDVILLATSREPLRAREEWVYRLRPLTTPDPDAAVTTETVLQYAAVELFVDRAKANSASFELGEKNVSAVCTLCRTLDGLPLAIELAASRVEFFGVDGLLAALDDRFHILTQGRRTALARHQTLRATLDWSYETLSERERVALRRLSIYKGAFDLRAGAAILTSDLLEYRDVFPCLSGLVDKSLLTANAASSPVTFRLLDSTRAYGLEKLVEHGEHYDTAIMHARFLCSIYTEPASYTASESGKDALVTDARVLDDVRSALDWSFHDDGAVNLGLELTWSSAPLWYQLSLFDEYRVRVNTALAFIKSRRINHPDFEYRLQLALAQADFLTQRLNDGVAVDAFRAALELAEQFGDGNRQLQVLYGIIVLTVMAGKYDDARDLLVRMSQLTETHPAHVPVYHRLQALVDTQRGDLKSARTHVQLALQAHSVQTVTRQPRDLTRYDHRTTVISLESRILWIAGYADDARRVAAESFVEALSLDHQLSLCCSIASGACPVACWRGDDDDLAHYLRILQALSGELSLINWKGQAQCYAFGLPENRVPHDTIPNLAQFDHLPPPSHEILATTNLRMLTPLALDRAHSGAAGWCTAEIFRAEGENLLMMASGDTSRAEALFVSAIDVARRQGAFSWELRATTSLARLKALEGHLSFAAGILESASERVFQGFGTRDVVEARTLLERIQQARRQFIR
jgi:predicted ATPase